MKNKPRLFLDVLLVVLSAGTALHAYADSGPTFYGQGSTGYYSAQGMTTANKTMSGLSDQPKGDNRWGFMGKEDLNDGLSALWQLESSFSLRTGAAGTSSGSTGLTGTALFDRVASVGLSSNDYGTLTIGRGPNMQESLNRDFDARSNWNFAGLKPIARYAGFHGATGINRSDNLVRYTSPEMAGFIVDGGYAFGTSDDGKNVNQYLGTRYKNGNFEAGYNHIVARLAANTINDRVDFFAAKYQFDKLTVNGGYVMTRNPSSATGGTFSTSAAGGKAAANTWFTGAAYQISPKFNTNVAWYQVEDKTATTNGKNDVRMFATGVNYVLSKQTELFADYAHAMRTAGANGAFTLYDGWASDGTSSNSKFNQSGISIGMVHRF
jgi:predicted porin